MPETFEQFGIQTVGGLNADDQADQLVLRNFQRVEGGFSQISPAESPKLQNIDFDSNGITKRLGSASESTLSTLFTGALDGDVLIRGTEWQNPSDGSRIQIIVSQKTVYTNQSGSWAQINNSNGTAYVHNTQSVAKVTFAKTDGHLFIGIDGANNPVLVYKSGTDLDDHFHNHTTGTTVDASSSSGQKVLNVASTANFIVGDRILINSAEAGYVASIQDGVSLTLEDNLASTYTTETVVIDNKYESAYVSGSSNSYTGIIGTGNYLVASIHTRLCYSDGNTLLSYTPMAHTASSGIYDVAGSTAGFYQSSGELRALISFTPHLQNELNEQLYIGTTAGMEVTTGFTSSDNLFRIEGSEAPFNHQTFANARNWVIYLTQEKNLMGVNGARVIDLGRRAKNTAADGPLNELSVADSTAGAFGFYHPTKQQAQFYFSTDSANFNDRCIVLDFKLGEPLLQETQPSFEQKVRLLEWDITDPSNNVWWSGMYQILGSVIGIDKTGIIYTVESGLNDKGSLSVDAYWFSPIFTANAEFMGKQWMTFYFRGLIRGDYDLSVDVYLDRADSDAPSKTWSFNQSNSLSVYGSGLYETAAYSTAKTTQGTEDIDFWAEAIQWRIYNLSAAETFVITSQNLHYMMGIPLR